MYKEKYGKFTKFINLTKFTNLTGILITWGLLTIALPASGQLGNVNFIFGISGNVWIKRSGNSNYERASTGWVNVADKLRLEKGASARVVCGNFRGSEISAPPSESLIDKICYPGKRKIKIRPGAKRCCTRNPNNPKVPYIISPRNTKIFYDQAISLRWNPVEGVKSYDVKISGPGVNWEKTNVNQPQVDYSGQNFSQNNFKPGSRYWVTVTADNGSSSSSQPPAGFTVLSEEDRKKIQAEISQLQQISSNANLSNANLNQTLGNDFKAFAIAEIYHSNGLKAAAIDALEGVIEQGSKTRAVYQRLGEIYQEVGLNRLARDRYSTALELAAKEQAEKEQNLAEKQDKALIQYRLGEVNQVIGDLKDSYKWYQAAQNSFRALGNKEQERLLQKKLDYLEQRK